jgi:xanthine dehydrogenase accessory factor
MIMDEISGAIDTWITEGIKIAIATVVNTWGSSPQDVGAKMVISEPGEFVGSVSGGCVEGSVIAEAEGVIKSQQAKLLHFGVGDETAWDVGLACGGEIEVFLEPVDDARIKLLKTREEYLEKHLSFVTARVIRGPVEELGRYLIVAEGLSPVGSMNTTLWDEVLLQSYRLLKEGRSVSKEYTKDKASFQIFFEHQTSHLRLFIIGGVHIAVSLALQARSLGYEVYIIDPRSAFGTEKRFPEVEGLISDWPDKALMELGLDPSTAVAVLTHDPKIDDPALRVALPSEAFYVGALGSQKTQKERHQRLLQSGVSAQDLSRLRGPIGLNLGGRKPEEIALSIMAEIVAVRTQSPLADRSR